MRANTLSRLRDERNVLRTLREMPLARTPQTGPISWRDIAILDGRIEPEPGHDKHNEALIRDAFNKSDPGQLKALRDGFDLAAEQVAAISSAFDNLAGPRLDLSGLSGLLDSIRKDLRRFEPMIVEAATETSEDEVEAATIPAPHQPTIVARRVSARSITNVTTREDALTFWRWCQRIFARTSHRARCRC